MSTPRASVFTRTFLLLGFLILFHSQEPAALAGPQANSAPPSDSVKLKKDIEILAGFEGKWACQGVFPSSGKRIESQIVFAPDLEGVWLSVRHDDLPPNRSSSPSFTTILEEPASLRLPGGPRKS
jgi:hypothetical protein